MPTIPIDTNYTYLTQQQFFLYLAFSYWLKGRVVSTGTSVNTAVTNSYNDFYVTAWPVIQTLDLNV